MAINIGTLATKLGLFFHAGDTIQTALQTTIEDEVEDSVQGLGGAGAIELESIRRGILEGLRTLQNACAGGLTTCVSTPARQLLIETVKADVQQPTDTLDYSISELITQMLAASESFDASTPAVAVSYGGDNVGTGTLIAAVTRFDGKINEHIIPELIVGAFSDAPSSGLATLQLLGEPSVMELSYNWPQGSACRLILTSQTAESADNLVFNGTMEDADTLESDLPLGWIASVATLGTTVKLTHVEQQTITVTGTPTTGYYLLHYTNSAGKVQTTVPLAYNASGLIVQSALQSIDELYGISVTSAGTSPDWTHTIVFTGVTNPGQLTSTELTDSGVYTHATSVAGSANVVRGARALELDSDGAQLTTIQTRVALAAETQYAVQAWFLADVVPAAGRYVVDLVDSIGATAAIRDSEGCANSCYFDADGLTTGWQALSDLVAAVNEVQTLSSTATGGTFKLIYDGQTTGDIAFGASAAAVETALEALSNIGVNDVVCAGGVIPATPITITFQNALGARNVPLITVDNTSATGGTAAVALTTEGNLAAPVFRTPATMPANTYLRIRATTAISDGTSVYLDEVCMVAMTRLYVGGPYVALFTGPAVWGIEDTALLTVTNDRAGAMHEWLNRCYGLREADILLPTNRAGEETVDDALIV